MSSPEFYKLRDWRCSRRKYQYAPTLTTDTTDPAALAALVKHRRIVIYDEGEDLAKAEEFAGELKGAGDVRFLGPGYAGWVAAGRPVATGARP